MALFDPDMTDPDSDLFAEVSDLYTANYSLPFDVMWLVQCGVLVFLMHLGFMTLEAGSVRMKNKNNIIFKNFLTVALSGITYYFWGYGLAYGSGGLTGGGRRFIGSGIDAFAPDEAFLDAPTEDGTVTAYGQGFYFFQWAFAATAATIVSGAVAGRMKLEAYFITAIWITSFVYPVVSHWIWASEGWLSAFANDDSPFFLVESFPTSCGMFDFAGSGVVHMTGGVAAFWAAYFLGPRQGWEEAQGHNLVLVFMGTMLLWLGWYGFNCGSTLVFDGILTGKVAVTTTLAPSSAVVFGMILLKVRSGKWDLVNTLNCALAGLVSITANCPFVDDWAAIPIGCIGALVYIYGNEALKKFGIDDPVGAIAVHGFCGAWGCLAAGIFGTPQGAINTYECDALADFVSAGFIAAPNSGQYQFTPLPSYQVAIQLIGVLAITAWVSAMTIPVFFVMKKAGFMRVSEEEEMAGLDASEHASSSAAKAVLEKVEA